MENRNYCLVYLFHFLAIPKGYTKCRAEGSSSWCLENHACKAYTSVFAYILYKYIYWLRYNWVLIKNEQVYQSFTSKKNTPKYARRWFIKWTYKHCTDLNIHLAMLRDYLFFYIQRLFLAVLWRLYGIQRVESGLTTCKLYICIYINIYTKKHKFLLVKLPELIAISCSLTLVISRQIKINWVHPTYFMSISHNITYQI